MPTYTNGSLISGEFGLKGRWTIQLGSQYIARDASRLEVIIFSMGFGRVATQEYNLIPFLRRDASEPIEKY